jgi:hypothetical protein
MIFREVTGVEARQFPVLAERLAIDLTAALRGAEAGLRGMRGRALLRRLWEGVTGRGEELPIAVGEDLLAAQRATLGVVREVMAEEARTQACVRRVLVNLHAVNRDLDAAVAGVERIEHEVARVRVALRGETARLAAEIEAVRGEVRREATLRRLTELYRAGELHPGAGEVLEGAMFLAAVGALEAGGERERRDDERRAALAVVKQRLPGRPLPVDDALLVAGRSATLGLAEAILYFAQGPTRGPCLAVLGTLAGRLLAGLPVGEREAAEAVAVVRATEDPDRVLETRLVRPAELAAWLAEELAGPDRLAAGAGEGHDDRGEDARAG